MFQKNVISAIMVAFSFMLVTVAQSAETKWTNGAGSCLWNNAQNWNSGLPTSSSTAVINSRINVPGWTTMGDPIIPAGTTGSAWHVDLGCDGWSEGTLIVNGTLNSTAIMMGYYQPHQQPGDENVGNAGILTINAGGVVNNSDVVMVGREGNGTLIMNGGILNTAGLTIADFSHSVSTVYLNSGQINVAWEFTMTSLYSSTGHGVGSVLIDNGTLRISDDDGSRIARLNKYIANGWIQAVAGKSLLITRDGAHDILAAVNEPGIANTLKNPSFETEGTNASSAQSWLAGNDNVFRTSEISARSGSWVMKINDSQQGTCFQNFPGAEIAGKKFIASVWAQYTDATFTTRGCIEIEFLQSGSAIAGIPVYFLDSNDPINTWKYYRIAAIAPAEATGVRLRLMNKGGSGELGTVYFDDAYFACTDMQQDLNDDKAVNFKDLFYLTNNWLDSNFLNDVQQPFVTDNFENYNSFDNLAYVWDYEPPWAPGTSTISLITDAGSAHSGSKAMSWQYDVTTNGIGELWAEIDSWNMTPVNVSLFDELHVWVNRHPGNSTESIFYLKFYQGGTDAENVAADAHIPDTEGSSSSPTGWTEWVINLHKDLIYFHAGYSKLSDLDDVRCILFGVDSKPGHIGGTGTIDIDDMVFVDYTPSCASNPAGDLNSDCIVNFEDIAVFAVNWMAIEL